MSIKVKVDAYSRRTLVKILDSKKRIDIGLKDAWFEIGRIDQKYLRNQMLKKDKTGRLYRYKGKLHRASAPWQFPANRSGKLAKSAGYIVRSHLEMEFGVKEKYGEFLEEGTSKMKKRKLVRETGRDTQMQAVDSILRNTDRRIKA